jgi:hypothetical protein
MICVVLLGASIIQHVRAFFALLRCVFSGGLRMGGGLEPA